MAEPIPMTAAGDSHARPHTEGKESALRAEIVFWNEMLETCGESMPPESRERMGFALALAEKRLKTLFEEVSPPGKASEDPPNVIHMDRRRRRA